MRAIKGYVALFLLLILGMGEACLGIKIGERYNVYIINDLNQDVLNVHCKSKDDDLGAHKLQVKEKFHFTFRVNLWGTTLFWCNFNWGNNINHGGGYRIFWYKDDLLRKCGYKEKECTWSARNSGIYLKNVPENQFQIFYEWQW
ncbi:hypothetical protein P3X46_006214 [Hevea brasiliensis]|uniref:S-protein homolog n=1 Tax=Hevea brasiliensis TaxID=3981 RepID=A0ABQ9MPH5_HEVBR|nr:S-protein homolog 21-like [Hevea brasiliensis]KAJ9182191.1 hypothetical protein P3X46_006214 [Hevea brasiliensis]